MEVTGRLADAAPVTIDQPFELKINRLRQYTQVILVTNTGDYFTASEVTTEGGIEMRLLLLLL